MKFLELIWKKWLKIARIIGNFQSQVILSIFYIIFLLPLGIIFSLFVDSLRIKRRSVSSAFSQWEHPKESLEEARRQY